MRFPVRTTFLMLMAVISRPLTCAAQDETKPTKEATLHKIEGVIVKVEKAGDDTDKKGPSHVKITVNTAAVWRDYVRDQAGVNAKDSAKTGADSIATKGQPESPSTTFLVEVGPKSHVATRFRAASDETSEGSRTVEGAEKKEGSPASDDVKRSGRDTKAPKTTVGDLKVGQFVEIEAKDGKASRLIVLKPISDPETIPKAAKPAK